MISISSNPVEFATSFVHLGSDVSNTGHLLTEINKRRDMTAVVIRDLWRPIARHLKINQSTSLQRPCPLLLLYGTKMESLSKTHASCIYGFEFQAIRTVGCTNSILCTMRSSTGRPASWAFSTTLHRCGRCHGHVMQRTDDQHTRVVYQFTPASVNWSRPRGKLHSHLKGCHPPGPPVD